jgi:geranylgeranyl diphosphate synthase type I
VDARKTLGEYKKKVEPVLEAFFERVISENEKTDKNIADAMKHARKITMSGGKRARAAFMYYGYLAAGGENKKEMLKTSISIELIHSFLLMHDDVIDRDGLRH